MGFFIKLLVRTVEMARLELERVMAAEGLTGAHAGAAREHLREAEKALREIEKALT